MYNNLNGQPMNFWCSVNGYESAKNYSIAPNQTMLLIDTQEPYMYMKTSNQMGQVTIKTFKIEEMSMNPQELAENEKYSDIEARLQRMEDMISKLGGNNNAESTI